MTTRAAAEAFFSAGTNRRMWRFTAMNFLCRDMEALKDTSRPTDRIRQDVNRSPGGDSEIFHTQCAGCHSGMDAVAGAYAYFEWDAAQGRMIHTPGQVQGKYAINTGVFPGGHITTDNSWINLWRSGQNAALGWNAARARRGFGAKGLGAEVAHSRAFAECQVQKVFEHVCFRPPRDDADAAAVARDRDRVRARRALRPAPGVRRRRDPLHGGRVAMARLAFAVRRLRSAVAVLCAAGLSIACGDFSGSSSSGNTAAQSDGFLDLSAPAGGISRSRPRSTRSCASTARRVTRATARARRTSPSRTWPRPIRRSRARAR